MLLISRLDNLKKSEVMIPRWEGLAVNSRDKYSTASGLELLAGAGASGGWIQIHPDRAVPKKPSADHSP